MAAGQTKPSWFSTRGFTTRWVVLTGHGPNPSQPGAKGHVGVGWAGFGPIFEWESNGFPASGPAARRLRHRGATRRLGVAARTPARRRLVGSWAPRARPRPRPSTGVISTAVRSRAQGRRRGVSQAARGGGGSTRQRATATCTHQHGAARTETRGHRPPHSTPPSFCAGPDLGPARGVAVVTRPGKGQREARDPPGFG